MDVGGRKASNLLLHTEYGHTDMAVKDLKNVFPELDIPPFDTPNPIKLIEMLSRLVSVRNDIILDFFSGSATTAHAVMQLNAEDGGKRKFIMVQYPELVKGNTGYANICEIGKERIRRAGEKIKSELENASLDSDQLQSIPDIGFKVFKVADTNINWNQENFPSIMNIQSFNKDTNKIRVENEYGQVLWNDIKYINPIVIIDEPQSMEGTEAKQSQTLKAIEDLKPLFILRYSATHKNLYNQIYKLDSYMAYKKNLVKTIRVQTIKTKVNKDDCYIKYLSFNRCQAKIEIWHQSQGHEMKFKTFDVVGNTSLYDLSGGLSQYNGMSIVDNPNKISLYKLIALLEILS
ncbi:MAG: hypothetical protein ATN33_01920 [Epulopiscium sp. Nele67-Bin001]|nr:MAG: hypothetical protein ATN33_01920 [Epulopiscium sp. Nele67-Bin001]